LLAENFFCEFELININANHPSIYAPVPNQQLNAALSLSLVKIFMYPFKWG